MAVVPRSWVVNKWGFSVFDAATGGLGAGRAVVGKSVGRVANQAKGFVDDFARMGKKAKSVADVDPIPNAPRPAPPLAAAPKPSFVQKAAVYGAGAIIVAQAAGVPVVQRISQGTSSGIAAIGEGVGTGAGAIASGLGTGIGQGIGGGVQAAGTGTASAAKSLLVPGLIATAAVVTVLLVMRRR